jgi:hypothetical protein
MMTGALVLGLCTATTVKTCPAAYWLLWATTRRIDNAGACESTRSNHHSKAPDGPSLNSAVKLPCHDWSHARYTIHGEGMSRRHASRLHPVVPGGPLIMPTSCLTVDEMGGAIIRDL